MGLTLLILVHLGFRTLSPMKNHLQTPNEIRPQIWKELGRASQDRHHEWRTPVLASVDPDQSAAAGDYLSPLPPGAVLPTGTGMAVAANAPAPTHNFAVLRAQVLQMDWLELSRDGHRRAQLGANTWEWLTP